MPDRHSMTEMHRSTTAAGGSVPSNYVPVADGAGNVNWAAPANAVASNTYFLATDGGQGEYTNLGNLGATEVIALGNGLYQQGTLNANCAVTFSGWTASTYCEVGLRLIEDGTGGWTPTFATVTWLGGSTPNHTTTAGTVTDYVFWSTDNGATIYGGQLGNASTISHPSVASNSYGGSVILTNDGTIALTSPTSGTFHFSAPFDNEVVTDAGDLVWYGLDLVHHRVRV